MDKMIEEHSLEDVALATATEMAARADWFEDVSYSQLLKIKQLDKDNDEVRAHCTELYEADSEARAEATELWFMYESCEDELDRND